MKKIYKSFFLLVLLGLNGGGLWAQNNFTALQGLINNTPNGGTLVLDKDYTAESGERLQIHEKSITLDLNGHVIDRNLSEAATNGNVIFITAYEATLTIVDSNPTATHSPAITYTNPVTNENVTVNGGIIMGGFDDNGGGIVNYGTLNLNGGTITRNQTKIDDDDPSNFLGNAGGILNGGTFNMTGGSVVGNTADYGGGILNVKNQEANLEGIFNMTGGTVSCNTARQLAGGIATSEMATTTICGNCTIAYNSAAIGGGIGNFVGATTNIYGEDSNNNSYTINITHNKALIGGGLVNTNDDNHPENVSYLNIIQGTGSINITYNDAPGGTGELDEEGGGGIANNGTLTVNGCTISQNTADYGGGVLNFGEFNFNQGTISDNTAEDGFGIYNAGTFNLSGSPVFGADDDIYLVCTKTFDLSSGYNYPITKAGVIGGEAGSIVITLGENLYDGRNIFESGAGTVTENDISLFTLSNGREIIMQYNANDPTTSQPVIEMYEHCWSGSGTQLDPYQIDDADGLACLARKVNAGIDYAGIYFQMTQDIDLSSVCSETIGNWTPIGYKDDNSSYPFKGHFDGANHVISGLYINNPNMSYQGLFGYAVGAEFKNITISNSTVIGGSYVGALCACASDFEGNGFDNCVFDATVEGSKNVGGLCGQYLISTSATVAMTFNNCHTTTNASVTTINNTISNNDDEGNVGGLVGLIIAKNNVLADYIFPNVTLYGCWNEGRVEGEKDNAGGLFGKIYLDSYDSNFQYSHDSLSFYLMNCHNIGAVAGGENVGGLMGGRSQDLSSHMNGTITNCYNTGVIHGKDYVGGIVGYMYNEEIRNSYNSGNITAEGEGDDLNGFAGGLIGMGVGDCHDSYNTGAVYGRVAGGICGGTILLISCTNCSNRGSVYGMISGGIGGFCLVGGVFVDCQNDTEGTVVADAVAGGIAGCPGIALSSTKDCENKGQVEGLNEGQLGLLGEVPMQNGAGGIHGLIFVGVNKLYNCTNEGQVRGVSNVGGIAGTMFPYYSVETLSGETSESDLEGILGLLYDPSGYNLFISKCENKEGASVIAAKDYVGGIVGRMFVMGSNSGRGLLSKEYITVSAKVLSRCSNNGTIGNMSNSYVGGIVGGVEGLAISNLKHSEILSRFDVPSNTIERWTAYISPKPLSRSEEPELVNDTLMFDCANNGTITGHGFVGGLCGFNGAGGHLCQSFNTGAVVGDSIVGGVVGGATSFNYPVEFKVEGENVIVNIPDSTRIIACYNTGSVSNSGAYAEAITGGVVGQIEDGYVECSYNYGTVTGGFFIGGVVGRGLSTNIRQNFNMGVVTGQTNQEVLASIAGGVVGGSYFGQVSDSYNAGRVSGYGVTGGVAGVLQRNDSYFDYDGKYMYNVGQVLCEPVSQVNIGDGVHDYDYRGGVVGALAYDAILSDAYYDNQMCTATAAVNQYEPHPGAAFSNCEARSTANMTGTALQDALGTTNWSYFGSGVTALYPQLTSIAGGSNIDMASSVVSVTPAFLAEGENVEAVRTSPFNVGTGNDVEWQSTVPFTITNGQVMIDDLGEGTLTVQKTVDGLQPFKEIVMISDFALPSDYWPDVVTAKPDGYVINGSNISINSAEGLAWLISVVNGYNGQSANDLEGKTVTIDASADYDMSAHYWVPIGKNDTPFAGTVVTNNNENVVISGIILPNTGISRVSAINPDVVFNTGAECDDQGLFGYASNADINHITMMNAIIHGDDAVGSIVGTISGSQSATGYTSNVTYCTTASNTVIRGVSNVGGIAGEGTCAFEYCTNTASLTGLASGSGSSIGGIIGLATANIENCVNNGSVTAHFTYGYVGGICGSNLNDRIEDCTNNGAVSTPAQAVTSVNLGGICGLSQGTNEHGVFSCENYGSVSCADNVGGIVSAARGVTISDCNNYGEISGLYEYTGATSGIVCLTHRNNVNDTYYNCVITNCVNSGSVNSGPSIGAVAGILAECEYVDITNCVNTGDLTGLSVVGGVAGAGEQFTVTNCFNQGDLTSSMIVAGIAGYCQDVTVTNCHNEGDVQVVGNFEVTLQDLMGGISPGAGGIVGLAMPDVAISSCYNIGHVSGGVWTGGIVSFIDSNDEAVSNCFNLGVIEGYSQMGVTGGIVGNFSVEDGVGTTIGIKNCYNAGPVKGYGMAGGIAAYCEANVYDCYNIGYVECTEVTISDRSDSYQFDFASALMGLLVTDNITPSATNCYYDKQMCPLENDYLEFVLATFTATPHEPVDNDLLTTAMVGSAMSSLLDATAWTFADGQYPQLNAYPASSNVTDVEASLVSTTPMFLENEETVEEVETSPFTVGVPNNLEWIHVDGANLLTFNNTEVTWSDTGTETVAVRHETDTRIQKLIRVNTNPVLVADGFWPDVVTVMPSTGYVVDADGNVSISSVEGLAWLISVVNGFNGQTANDLVGKTVTIDASVVYNMGAHYWVPINSFKGTFTTSNGNVVTIDRICLPQSGISTESTATPGLTYQTGANYCNQGLFGHIIGGTVENVILGKNSVIVGNYEVGGICGYMEGGTIEHCTNRANVGGRNEVGGILGYGSWTTGDISLIGCTNSGTLTNTYVSGSKASNRFGGIAGMTSGQITDCHNTADLNLSNRSEDGKKAGGIVGYYQGVSGKSILRCSNTGNITGDGSIGGICGSVDGDDILIDQCFNTGNIVGNAEFEDVMVAGICAAFSDGTISNCYNTGNISLEGFSPGTGGDVWIFGGICAWTEDATIEKCYNTGNVTGVYAGGICGFIDGSTMTDCYNTGEVSGMSMAGGLVAYSVYTNISLSFNLGSVNARTNLFRSLRDDGDGDDDNDDDDDDDDVPVALAGGIGVQFSDTRIIGCYNAGWVSGEGAAGGLVAIISFGAGYKASDQVAYSYNIAPVFCTPVAITGAKEYGRNSRWLSFLPQTKEEIVLDFHGGLFGACLTGNDFDPLTLSGVYYDKQTCTQQYAYYTFDGEDFASAAGVADYAKSTQEMFDLGSDPAWSEIPAGHVTYGTNLYPELTIFHGVAASTATITPAMLSNNETVDGVYTDFNVGTTNVTWSHHSGDAVLDLSDLPLVTLNGSTGTEVLAVTCDGVSKYIYFTTAFTDGLTWVDVVAAEPDGYDDLDINSAEDLAWFCSRVNGFNGETSKPYLRGVITADIDLSAHCWVPIGFDYPDVNSNIEVYYTGSFDGNYHNIDGINIDYQSLKASPVLNSVGGSKENRDHRDNIGFFGGTDNAFISKVILASGTISGYNDENYTNYMGGMVGFMMEGRIRNCVSNLTLTRSNYEVCMGGLVGRCDSGKILNCTSLATLEANQGMIGGLIGTEETSIISDCYANAKFNVQPLDKGDYSTYVGGIYGSLWKGESGDVVNCYVRLRDDSVYGLPTKEDKDGGGGDPHLFGLFAAASYNGSFSHCYAPEGTGYPYVAEAAEVRFVKATSDDFLSFHKEHSYVYTQITTVAGGNQYHIMPWDLDDAFVSLIGSTQQGDNSVEFLSDSYNEEEQFRIDVRSANDNTNHYGIRHKEGDEYDLGYDNNTGMLVGNVSAPNPTWDIVQFPGESAFKVSNYPYSDICLALHNNGNGTYTFGAYDITQFGGDSNYDFHINFFTEDEIPSDGNLYGCGTYTAAVYPYTYSDPRGGSVVTLDNADEDDYATSGETTLLDALNNWVVGNYVGTEGFETYIPDPDWGRFGSALNGDYPVHCYYDPDNIKPADANAHDGGDEFSPTAKVIVTTDKAKGYPFRYYHHVADALAYCNAQTDGGIVCVYGSDDMRNADTQENNANVDVYVNGMTYMQCEKLKSGAPYTYYTFFGDNAAAKSTDWYVSLLQDEGKSLTVTTGFNLDNSDATDFAGANYDWHMVSSPLQALPVGISYPDQEQHDLNSLPECGWDATADGLFPDDTPYNSFDFYAYSEPYYHWMNFKRNSASHWFQDTGEHIDGYENDQILVPGHGYLIAMDKEVFMQAKGELNNGDVEVGVTYSGEHNKGLNYLGNPYQSSLDFDAFVTKNESLWENPGDDVNLEYSQSYLILDADEHCYKYYAQDQSNNPEQLSRYIWPFQGFYVGVYNPGTATFTNDMRVIGVNRASYMRNSESDRNDYPLVNLKVTDVEDKSDMFTVELGRPEWGGSRKEKEMTAGSGMLWSRHDDKEYSILFSGEGVDEIPVRFSAKKAGAFTMTWSHYNGEFNYLHLIDNMTGMDIDCLTTESYSFEGKTDDYQSRFKLVFSMSGDDDDDDENGASTGSATFAFQMGDELVVNGEGMLQMFDVNGRCLMSTELYGQQNTISLPTAAAGVYVLRLTSGENVKVQKMVVR